MTFHALYTSKSTNSITEAGSIAPMAQPAHPDAIAGGVAAAGTHSAVSTLNSRAMSENSTTVPGTTSPAPGDSPQGHAESYNPTDPRQATVEIVIPVYNEATSLPTSVTHLVESLSRLVPFTSVVTIADNASIDNTWIVAGELERQLPSVRRVHLDQKGRGRMLKKVWLESQCDVVAYMDVDLSTDLHALLPLLAPLVSDHSDIAIGSRLARSANVVRGSKREFISRTYNHMLRLMMSAHFSDAQCGFKAMRTDVARAILPHVEDPNWFFDTEVLLLAEKAGYRIHEVPVDWTDDPDSRVNVVETALQDLRGMWRVRRNIATHRINLDSFRRSSRTSEPPVLEGGEGSPGVPAEFFRHVWRFGIVGIASTVAYAVLYLAFSAFLPAQINNFLCLLITAILNTAANRAFTFGISGRKNVAKDQLSGLIIFLVCWLVTSLSLVGLSLVNPHASARTELIVLTVANVVATIIRFVALRAYFYSFRYRRRTGNGR